RPRVSNRAPAGDRLIQNFPIRGSWSNAEESSLTRITFVGPAQLDAELSCVEIELKIVCSEPPSADRAAIRPMATRAAIRPYSIAVAPDSPSAKVLRISSI